MRDLFYAWLGYFLTVPGLVLLAALDSSVIFFLPLGVDFGVVILSARTPDHLWLYAVLATLGSLVGAAVTFWIGRKVGEHGLARFVSASRLERIQRRVRNGAALSVAALGIIPPPFPFTAFVLTSGACRVNPWTFLATLGVVRAIRFGAEAALAGHYGRGILAWMQSSLFTLIVGVLTALAIIGTIVSAVALYRSTRTAGRGGAVGEPG
jgi:membrane protein YqaA with SNARE-associated domain